MSTAVAVIALRGNQVLLVRNAKRNRSPEIPGGALVSGESIFDAAVRELFEETGLVVEPGDLVPFHEKDAHGWHVHIFRAVRWSGDLKAGDDAESAFWGPLDLILEGRRSEDCPIVIRAIHQHKAAFGR
jgi:8-oxo-dGTP diphosphatase